MSHKFRAKKHEILGSLSRPSADYIDASPKGSVDEGVHDLIGLINGTPGFVTTSSCAGRIAVYLEGPPKRMPSQSEDYDATSSLLDSTINLNISGKGGGKWLFTSHTPVDLDHVSAPGSLFRLLGFSSNSEVVIPSEEINCQFVHFKFEPMILHILSSSAEDAQAALQAAMQSGFRESGISGILDNKGYPSTPMVAVRSSGLALDSIIGFKEPDSHTTGAASMQPMVSESYLRTLLRVANERFKTNEQRKLRFAEAFNKQRPARVGVAEVGIESKAARRVRKRAEGLARKQQMLLVGGALDGTAEDASEDVPDDDTDYNLTLLMDDESEQIGAPRAQQKGL